jgi:AAA family ATP:ADP antiporter
VKAPDGNSEPGDRSHAPNAFASAIGRVLSIVADVRKGEAVTALLLALDVFVLLGAYYVLKVAREPLVLRSGAAYKVYASAVMALLLVPLLKGFERLTERFDRMRVFACTTSFFLVCLFAFSVLSHTSAPIGFWFFVWVGIFNVFVVAQFWSFANDVYTEEQGNRLFPIVAAGSSAGAIVGGKCAGALFDVNHVGRLFALVAALLAASLVLTWWVHRREGVVVASRRHVDSASAALRPGDALRMMLNDRYLVLIALLAVIYNCVNTLGEYVLDRGIVHAAHGSAAQIAAFEAHFRANFFTVVNVLGLLLQLFAVSRVLKYFGVRVALFVMPVISLLGYTGIAAVASLAVMSVAKASENSVDYSLQNTTRQALFLPTSREAKYKVKALVDTFFVRVGDVVAAALVWLGSGPLRLDGRAFAVVNVALVSLWLVVVWRIAQRHPQPVVAKTPAPSWTPRESVVPARRSSIVPG